MVRAFHEAGLSYMRIARLRFVRERLCPWLRPGGIVLMDNLGARRGSGARARASSFLYALIRRPAGSC